MHAPPPDPHAASSPPPTQVPSVAQQPGQLLGPQGVTEHAPALHDDGGAQLSQELPAMPQKAFDCPDWQAPP